MDGLEEPGIPRAAPGGDPKSVADRPLEQAGFAGRRILALGREGDIEHLLARAAEDCQDPMRGHAFETLAPSEVIRELRALGRLSFSDLRDELTAAPELCAQTADQIGILGEELDEDGARAFEGGLDIRHAARGGDVGHGPALWDLFGLRKEDLRERFEPGLPGCLGLRPPLRPEGQIEVFQTCLRVGRFEGRREGRVHPALRRDAVGDDATPVVEVAEIGQPTLETAQLRVVETASILLPVARDERHGGPSIEERHSGGDLRFPYAEFLGNERVDGFHAISGGDCGRT